MFERKDERKEQGEGKREREREPKRSDVSGSRLSGRRLRTHSSERASSNRRTHACIYAGTKAEGERREIRSPRVR